MNLSFLRILEYYVMFFFWKGNSMFELLKICSSIFSYSLLNDAWHHQYHCYFLRTWKSKYIHLKASDHVQSDLYEYEIASCSIEIFRFLAISIVELKNTHFRRVLPVFWAFPVQGPIIIASRTIVREVMMGPRTGNAQKTGKTEAEMGILKLNNGNVRNLKILMLHIVLWHFFHIGTKTVF